MSEQVRLSRGGRRTGKGGAVEGVAQGNSIYPFIVQRLGYMYLDFMQKFMMDHIRRRLSSLNNSSPHPRIRLHQ